MLKAIVPDPLADLSAFDCRARVSIIGANIFKFWNERGSIRQKAAAGHTFACVCERASLFRPRQVIHVTPSYLRITDPNFLTNRRIADDRGSVLHSGGLPLFATLSDPSRCNPLDHYESSTFRIFGPPCRYAETQFR
jgi:hypothetical protein